MCLLMLKQRSFTNTGARKLWQEGITDHCCYGLHSLRKVMDGSNKSSQGWWLFCGLIQMLIDDWWGAAQQFAHLQIVTASLVMPSVIHLLGYVSIIASTSLAELRRPAIKLKHTEKVVLKTITIAIEILKISVKDINHTSSWILKHHKSSLSKCGK